MTEKKELSMKERMQIPRTKMREQDAQARAHYFTEVNLGYTEEMALTEAERCIMCKKPTCVEGCPVEVDIPGFIQKIRERDYIGASAVIKETNLLGAVCGRVCPQEEQCEGTCVLAKKGDPVAIGHLERFVSDYDREHGKPVESPSISGNGCKVAVVGSGPAGLTVACDLAKLGHDVVVFEALHAPGGVLIYGIPEFRLPKAILAHEIGGIRKLGVDIRLNQIVGKLYTIDELMQEEGFDAVFIGTGAGTPKMAKIPGENLVGVMSANEFLVRAILMHSFEFPIHDTPTLVGKKVGVIGGGNTAMDVARTALRLGAEKSYVLYRRGREEMPARVEEIHHAEEEGILFELLISPVQFLGENGALTGIEMLRCELGEPDDSGRRRPVPIEGSNFVVDLDVCCVAIGTNANPLIKQTTPDLQLNKWGYIEVDEETGMSISKPGVFAGGDIVTGAATVILAMGAGRTAARGIHEYLQSLD